MPNLEANESLDFPKLIHPEFGVSDIILLPLELSRVFLQEMILR